MSFFDFFKKSSKNVDNYDDIYEDYDDYEDESLSMDEMADIWMSNGMDEDYNFGYSDDELRSALDDDF